MKVIQPAQFLVTEVFWFFDPDLPLLWAMGQHFAKVASESCGKCSPCRTGAPILRDALLAAQNGKDVDWNEIVDIAHQMNETALCGIGKDRACSAPGCNCPLYQGTQTERKSGQGRIFSAQ